MQGWLIPSFIFNFLLDIGTKPVIVEGKGDIDMKVGIDLHGVCTLYSDLFRYMSFNLMMNKHEVHIITGMPWKDAKGEVKKLGISFSHYFSIIDYHKKIRTKMWKDNSGGWCVDQKLWVRAKGDYIHRQGIELHFDDTWEYSNYIPDNCTFVLVPKKGFENFLTIMFMDAYGG